MNESIYFCGFSLCNLFFRVCLLISFLGEIGNLLITWIETLSVKHTIRFVMFHFFFIQTDWLTSHTIRVNNILVQIQKMHIRKQFIFYSLIQSQKNELLSSEILLFSFFLIIIKKKRSSGTLIQPSIQNAQKRNLVCTSFLFIF